MFESIRCIKDKTLKEQYIKFFLRNKKKKHFSVDNNNDTFDIYLSLVSYVKLFIISIFNNIIHYIQLLHQFVFKFHFLVLLIFMLFTFAFSLDNNSEIPTSLIISAYFPNKSITRITYDMLLEKEKQKKVININYDEYQNLYDSFNENKSEDNIPCDNYGSNNHENQNYRKEINKNKINDDSSLKEMFSKIRKPKKGLPNWNSLMAHKNLDYFIFYNETFKTTIILVFSFLYFYFFIKFTIYSKIKDSFIFNAICIIITFIILYILYQFEFFFSSNFFFILLMYNNKCLIESVYINLKYNRKDFEIFSPSLIAFNFIQFCLKTIVLLNLTMFSGILSIFFFRTWLNFILFYICLFTYAVFLANCLESLTSSFFKPVKNLIIFSLGIVNFLFSKLLLHFMINKIPLLKNMYTIILDRTDIDSLYFISDLFTLFCFDYIRGFLEFQIEAILLIDHFIETSEKEEKINFKNKEILEKLIIWPLLFIICVLFCVLDLYLKEKICILMSIYLSKILVSYYSNVYDIQYCKFIFYAFSLLFLVFNIEFSCCEENNYIINLLYLYTRIDKSIITTFLKTFISILIYYFIITVNFIITMISEEKSKIDNNTLMKRIQIEIEDKLICNEKTEKKDSEFISFLYYCISINLDLICNYFLICLLIAIYQYYEESIIIKILNALTISILCISKTIYLKDISNTLSYYFSNYIWLLISLRLISLCYTEFSIIFCICHINLQVFIYYFYITKKNNALLNILFLLTVIIRCWQIYSLFLVINTIFIIFAIAINFIYTNINYLNEEENKNDKEQKDNNENYGILNIYISLSFLFLIPIVVFFIIYLKFPKYHFIINYFDKIVKDMISVINEYYENFRAKENFDWIDSFEFNFIDYMINIIEKVRTDLEIK